MNHAISVESLSMQYGKLQALDNVSFEINTGETFVLLGPNGAGKSTCVEILEGFRKRTSGNVSVLGKDPDKFTRADRASLGIVLQQGGDLGKLTVREIITHFALMYPNPRNVDEVIDAVNLSEKANQPIRKLSGGQQHRVDVALGIIGNPEVLFLDEPTTGFDPEVRRQFWDVIKRFQQEGTTIMLTTHYLDEAEELAERAGIIIGGKLVAVDDIDKIGGTDRRQTKIRWRDNGQLVEQSTSSPAEAVAQLYSKHGELDDLEIKQPSLEAIYLEFLEEYSDATAI
jgi:ABC-2 type transport system ATP-binding protein